MRSFEFALIILFIFFSILAYADYVERSNLNDKNPTSNYVCFDKR